MRPPETSSLVAAVTGRYDSNVARVNDAAVSQSRLVKEDFRLTPSLQLNWARNLGRHQVGVRSAVGYDFYARNKDLNRSRFSVEPSLFLDLPVCNLMISGLAARQQSDLGDLVIVGLDPSIGVSNNETRKRLLGRAVCGDQYGLRPNFEAEIGSGNNSSSLRQLANYSTTRFQTGLGYSTPALGEIGVFAFRSDTDLPNQLTVAGQPGGYTQRGYGLNYQRAIGTRLTFSGSVSHVEIEPYGPVAQPSSGLNASASLRLLASERLQVTAFANRNFTSTLTSFSTYELAEGYGATVNLAANDRLRFRFGGQVAPRQFFYAVTPVVPVVGELTQYDAFAGASYNIGRRIRFNLDGGYQKRDADINLFDYDSVYAAFGVSITL